MDRGKAAGEQLPEELVYAGFSLGLMPAQLLAQTRPGAQGAVLLHGAIPASEFGEWPQGLRAQIHTARDDEWGDLDVAEELAGAIDTVELFVYPGDRHLFTDSSLADYDPDAAALVKQRILDFLES
jgi:dienelactone hydrolase